MDDSPQTTKLGLDIIMMITAELKPDTHPSHTLKNNQLNPTK